MADKTIVNAGPHAMAQTHRAGEWTTLYVQDGSGSETTISLSAEHAFQLAWGLTPELERYFDERRAAETAPPSGVIEEIAGERARQIKQEKWSAGHDDEHRNGELSRAAACYAAHASAYQRVASDVTIAAYQSVEPQHSALQYGWPWSPKWWKPKAPRRDLIRAAALIVAEIERLDRAVNPSVGE